MCCREGGQKVEQTLVWVTIKLKVVPLPLVTSLHAVDIQDISGEDGHFLFGRTDAFDVSIYFKFTDL